MTEAAKEKTPQENGQEPGEQNKGWRGDRHWLLGLAVALAVCSVLVRWLYVQHLEQTALLFIGIPFVLVCLMIFVPTKTTLGSIFKGITLALLYSGIALGEGLPCILMAAPFFYAGAALIWFIVERTRKSDPKIKVLLLLPVAFLSFEGIHPKVTVDKAHELQVRRVLQMSGSALRKQLLSPPALAREQLPFGLRIFPHPVRGISKCQKAGCLQGVVFNKGKGDKTLWYRIEKMEPQRLAFAVVKDGSKIAHWLLWRRFDIRWKRLDAKRIEVQWKVSFTRELSPAWYFGPIERVAVRSIVGSLLDRLESRAK